MPLPPPALPSYDEVAALPILHAQVVPPDFIDANGHVNIRHHLDLCARGAEALCIAAGVDEDYRRGRGLGLFTAEHHIRYTGELLEGDAITVHARFLDRSARSGHLVSLLLDRERRALACVVEIAVVHVDLHSRRPAPFPDDVAAALDRLVAESRAVSWPAPASGCLGVRR